jgi:D-beta-D-heptose 7-phosphate kinase/D-beta-D-heptose 1-phosphate adenosyltransferase
MEDSEIASRAASLHRLRALFTDIGGSKVTLIGDTMLDRYHHGFANNLNSTAPVPVLKITRTEESPGASAHVAIGLASFGLGVSFHTAVGTDPEGDRIIQSLKELEIDTSNIIQVDERKTLTKTRFYGSRESLLEKDQILLQADRGPGDQLDDSVSALLTKGAIDELGNSTALVISDYDKGVISHKGAQSLISSANDAGIPSIVDPKLTGLEKSRGCSVVIFEKRGLSLLTRRNNCDNSDIMANQLIEEYDWGGVLILGGVDGVSLYQRNTEPTYFDCMAPSAEQQIGMHDAAATSLAAALGYGLDLPDAALLASAACDCVLSANTGEEYVDRQILSLWLDELSWQLQISDR